MSPLQDTIISGALVLSVQAGMSVSTRATEQRVTDRLRALKGKLTGNHDFHPLQYEVGVLVSG